MNRDYLYILFRTFLSLIRSFVASVSHRLLANLDTPLIRIPRESTALYIYRQLLLTKYNQGCLQIVLYLAHYVDVI